MNSYQQHAIQLLDKLLQPRKGKRTIRCEELLCRTEPLKKRIGIPKSEFCQGWIYDVGTCFADALDCELQSRVKNKQKYWLWTQGVGFAFSDGHTIHRADGTFAIQILDSDSASSSTGSGRDAGTVVFQLYKATHTTPAFKKLTMHKTTQDDFIRFLITGEIQNDLL